MRTNFLAAIILVSFISCQQKTENIVKNSYIDSLVTDQKPSLLTVANKKNFEFWETRMKKMPDNFVSGPEYAAALSSRFHFTGDIQNLLESDSLYMEALKASQQKVPGLYRTMAYLSIQQHQFNRADSFLQNAIKIEGLTVANAFLEFDVVFEKGQYKKAKNLLESLKKGNSYGYLFRRAKFEHYDGNLDSAISCMIQAANKAGSSKYLRQSALSNAGDLLLHKGAVENAAKLYRESIKIDASDLHSITGLGNIALLYDKNDTLAEKIFKYVQKNTNAPDILLKLIQVTEARNDSIQMMKYANEFVNKASAPEYGNMYNKYLIDLYTGIINKPEKAIELAENEINSRPTAQIFAWYAWSLSRNKEVDKAYTIYKGHISSQPLEGLELYYMGKMMKGLDKEYNAQQFFKAAWKNRFDLGPAKQLELKEYLSQ